MFHHQTVSAPTRARRFFKGLTNLILYATIRCIKQNKHLEEQNEKNHFFTSFVDFGVFYVCVRHVDAPKYFRKPAFRNH